MYGQLGQNSSSHEYLPRKVPDLMGSEVIQIACGRCHVLVYLANKRVYSFGLGCNGQLGIGAFNVNKLTPTVVSLENLTNVKSDAQNSSKETTATTTTFKATLISISAGGDQSFIITYPESSSDPLVKAHDFRTILSTSQILTVNVVKSCNSLTLKSQLHECQTVFASASCLNASFLDANLHYTTSNRYPGLDLSKVKDIHNLLSSLNNDYLNEMIIEKLTKLFENLPESPPSIEALRLYVTAPFLTEFEQLKPLNEMSVHSLLFAYAQSINKLKKEAAGRVLDYWFAWTGVEFFKKLIFAYKAIVCHIINLKEVALDKELIKRHEFLKSSMIFLQKLHKINLEFREIVGYETFYIPDLADKVDIKKDYFEWLRRKNLRNFTDNVLFCDYPFVFDGRAKTLLLQTDADIQMQVALQEAWAQNINSIFLPTIDPVNPLLTLFIRREHIVQDTLNQLSKQKRDDLKKPLKVMFIGEDGYDAGGVKKEFFLLLLREILDLKYGMFIFYEETNTIWFNDQTLEGSDMYQLIGQLCGLAIYNSTIINLPFPLTLYKKLLKESPTIADMHELMPSVARSLESLLKYESDDFTEVFDLTFEVTRQRFDQTVNVELIPNGSTIQVTKENVKQYVNAYIDYIFNKSVELPFQAFNNGFHHVCGSKVLELFHPSELQSMVIGNENYDFFEFESNAEYKGDYNPEHPVIKRFWKCFHALTIENKKKFLIFLTGTDRIPILGMKRVKIYIQSTNGGDSYFPVAHTCFNLLDLPQYSTNEILAERLNTAIQHTEGFTIV
jgi:E3 ubiquitin-protein ligase HERC4